LTGLPPLAGNKKMQRTTFQREAGGRKDVQEAESLLHTFLSTRESFAKNKQRTFISFQLKEELFCYEKSCVFPVGKGNRTKFPRGRGVFLPVSLFTFLAVLTINEI
jgi:hypothetical protein